MTPTRSAVPARSLQYTDAVDPPTTSRLRDPAAVPYFAWELRKTVGELREILASSAQQERDEVIVRLLREANSRDVWLFVDWDDINDAWPRIEHRLGRSRDVWGLMRRRHEQHARRADPR